MIQRSTKKIFRNLFPHTCTSRSKCMTCISLWFRLWLSNICDTSMPTFIPTQNSTQKALVVGYEKKANLKCLWWGIIHNEWSSESFEKLTFLLQKFIKPPDRWLIKEQMIGNSVIPVLSCNRPRTWKSYKPHKHQGKRVDKCQLT
jgi:hypothetical protein